MSANPASLFQKLPSIDSLLQADSLQLSLQDYGHNSVRDEGRRQLVNLREAISSGDDQRIAWIESAKFLPQLCEQISEALIQQYASSLKAVFNLTGTVVHTNLGRAALPESAINAMNIAAREATNLEFDLESGKRGDRDSHLERSLCEITGAQAATVVNNNAAAVLLVLNTLALNKEVPISRGELVEIGGAFRIPEVMASAGSILREIGTTNRTHLSDYEDAINAYTGLLMKVHTSNYEILGFTASPQEQDIAELAQRHGIAFVNDLGSGTLVDLQQFGLPKEPTVTQALEAGADIVTFSGDKLLGGPQAGIIVGSKDLIEKIKKNPLKRALRVNKITLAALLEVIKLYRDPQRLTQRLPILRDLTRPVKEIEAVAQQLLEPVSMRLKEFARVEVCDCKSQIGSGALPLDLLPSRALMITPLGDKGADALLRKIAEAFRGLPKPVIGRINDGHLYFDLRCLRDIDLFRAQLNKIQL